jgi:hypothetical protein
MSGEISLPRCAEREVHHECHEMRETRLTGVPVTTQLVGDLLDAASTLTDLTGQPASGSVGDEVSGKGNAGVDVVCAPIGEESTMDIDVEAPRCDDASVPRRPVKAKAQPTRFGGRRVDNQFRVCYFCRQSTNVSVVGRSARGVEDLIVCDVIMILQSPVAWACGSFLTDILVRGELPSDRCLM